MDDLRTAPLVRVAAVRPGRLSDQLGDLTKVADQPGTPDTKTTEGYRHTVPASLPHAVDA
jgi:hypothetical protein